MSDELTPEELAFERSGEMTWRGIELQPFSYLRKTAAMALLRYFQNNMPEAAIVVWLCLQSDDVVRRARRDPASVENAIDQWADQQGILCGLEPDVETQRVYDTITADIAASASVPVGDDGAEKKSETEPAAQLIT